jgi:SET domain-containing protein
MSRDIAIKKSKIGGLGVFANRDFRKGEIVLKWKKSRILTRSQLNKLSDHQKNYIVKIGKNKYALLNSPEKFVNHSCLPNTYSKNSAEIASRKIKKDEEIVSSYQPEQIFVSFKCKCESKNCRKFIKKLI